MYHKRLNVYGNIKVELIEMILTTRQFNFLINTMLLYTENQSTVAFDICLIHGIDLNGR